MPSAAPQNETATHPTVYCVEGHHWDVPNVRLSLHATPAGAEARALELLNILLADAGAGQAATLDDAKARLTEALRDRDLTADDLVAIFPRDIEP